MFSKIPKLNSAKEDLSYTTFNNYVQNINKNGIIS